MPGCEASGARIVAMLVDQYEIAASRKALLSENPDLETKFAGATLPPLEKGD